MLTSQQELKRDHDQLQIHYQSIIEENKKLQQFIDKNPSKIEKEPEANWTLDQINDEFEVEIGGPQSLHRKTPTFYGLKQHSDGNAKASDHESHLAQLKVRITIYP